MLTLTRYFQILGLILVYPFTVNSYYTKIRQKR